MPEGLPPIAIVVSRYNREVTDRLLAGAVEEYERHGGSSSELYVVDAPGAFEIVPLVAAVFNESSLRCDGVVAIGCIIKGETIHDEVLAHAVTDALARIAAKNHRPVGLAVLTVNDQAQAEARAGGVLGNKGSEAMLAVLQTLAAIDRLRSHSEWHDPNVALARIPSPGDTAPSKIAKPGARSDR